MDHSYCDKCGHMAMGHVEGMCEACHEGHMMKCDCGDPDSHKKGGDEGEAKADEGGE